MQGQGCPLRGVTSPVPAPGPGAPCSPASTAATSTFVSSGPVTDLRDPSKLPRAVSRCSFPHTCDTPPGGQQTLPVLGGYQLSPPIHGQQRQPKESSDLLPPPTDHGNSPSQPDSTPREVRRCPAGPTACSRTHSLTLGATPGAPAL
ncbi:hypothetical protein HJG60_008981 [Phyllostomus discolor]|uniref:Uncharacterized protein n=1 Tax=Phyllostomus discolor TaxID=89673 RepID=A0A833YQ37_9CHIR|nr:hypothetical protein HJG60_008981 [Phyllostomus discolor]